MFGSMTLGQSYTSKEYKKIESELHMKLFDLQRACEEHKISVLVTITGVDGAGRGEVVNMLSSWLDAKKMRNHTFWNPSEEDKSRPESWRYWMSLPKHGEVGVFSGGWYSEPLRKASTGEMTEEELYTTLNKRVELERTLADSGCVIIKLWLHISEEEHALRREQRKKNKMSYHFTPYDEKSDANYTEFIDTVSKAIPMSDREFAPWCIIDAYDKKFRDIAVARTLIDNIEHAINKKLTSASPAMKPATENTDGCVSILDRVDLSQDISKNEYKKQLVALQNEVFKLTFEAYTKGISTTLIFEGWDAGGKGGTIRRLASGIDARITRIIPISSPTDEELAHHYLWRFWRHVPKSGYVTIYDRSWYGRVLVERVENYAKPEDWKRAYSEINDFEEQLVDNKNILIKFWLHISSEEQLTRFKNREETPWKNYKITEDDWRNREKTPLYKVAADEMFMRTNTINAPWVIIPAESKIYARIEVLKVYRDALQKALGKEKSDHDAVPELISLKEMNKANKNKAAKVAKKDKKDKKDKAEKTDKKDKAEKAETAEKTDKK